MTADLFEMVANAVGCNYISDLRFEPHNSEARIFMRNQSFFRGYPLNKLIELYEYIYDKKVNFLSVEEALIFYSSGKKRK